MTLASQNLIRVCFNQKPHLMIELDSMQDYFTATCPQVLDYKGDGNAVENLQIPKMSTSPALPKSESSYAFPRHYKFTSSHLCRLSFTPARPALHRNPHRRLHQILHLRRPPLPRCHRCPPRNRTTFSNTSTQTLSLVSTKHHSSPSPDVK
jgi:hypothetical protein